MLALKYSSQIFVPEFSLLLLFLLLLSLLLMLLLLLLLLMLMIMMSLLLLLLMMMLNFQLNPRIRELKTPVRRHHHLRGFTIHLRHFA
jgi:hypothetical protein